MYLDPTLSFDAISKTFRWDLPTRLNMACQVCDDHAPEQLAIVDLRGQRTEITYGALAAMADRIAAEMVRRGVGRGDRVGVLRSQSPETAAAHIAIWRLGAISVPLFVLFGPDALQTRVRDSGLKVLIIEPNGPGQDALQAMVPESLSDAAHCPAVATGPEDPAVLIYTSGTTGAPKGALHGHRILTGHLPGVVLSHDFLGQEGDCLWTPADWAWIGGLFDVLMPGLALGVPVVAARLPKFTAAACEDILLRGSVRNAFFPPTALRMLRAEEADLARLRSVASGGEPLGQEILDWGRSTFGCEINEFYGQTECNMVVSSCAALFDVRPGAMGKPVPGHEIAVIDETGAPTTGEGDIAIKGGSASMMLGYWNNTDATAEKYRGDWLVTGDRGMIEDGYVRFLGREDDVITSAGYRIGPAEIEDSLTRHPAIAMAGVVGKPDAQRTQIVKAYVVLKPGKSCDAAELCRHVGERLSRHLVPREVEFVTELPLTVTGKVIRKELRNRAAREAMEQESQ